jgi:hypothetical protein
MPLAEVFYGMTARAIPWLTCCVDIAKLKRILPRQVFRCATVLNIGFQRQVVGVWNGGLPDGYLLHGSGEQVPLVSRHLPL